jgi:hypothetical protein
VHVDPNPSLLVEPEVMGLPSLLGILQRKAKFLQSEENKLVNLTEGNLQDTVEVSECSLC